jgi:hypothetical protein
MANVFEAFEDMRRLPVEMAGAPCHCVGGFIEQSTITASGIISRIIHAWPDDVGQPIDLEAAERHAEAIAEMEKLSLMELAQRIDAAQLQRSERRKHA